jgi:hypothetical protein
LEAVLKIARELTISLAAGAARIALAERLPIYNLTNGKNGSIKSNDWATSLPCHLGQTIRMLPPEVKASLIP